MLALYLHLLLFSLPLVRFGGRDEIKISIEFTIEITVESVLSLTYYFLLQFGDNVTKLLVVGGDAVVEVDGNGLFCHYLEALVVFLALFDVDAEAVEAATLGRGEVGIPNFETLRLAA
jgi:hypothetical protein